MYKYDTAVVRSAMLSKQNSRPELYFLRQMNLFRSTESRTFVPPTFCEPTKKRKEPENEHDERKNAHGGALFS